jgi:hypothetical protein
VTGVNEVPPQTPHRPRVRGLTAPEFDNVGTPDLRFWLRWWSDPERDPSGDEEAGRDPLEEQRKIKVEIRRARNSGSPGRTATEHGLKRIDRPGSPEEPFRSALKRHCVTNHRQVT